MISDLEPQSVPAVDPGSVRLSWDCLLRSPPARLWPYVADTRLMSCLAHVAPARFSERRDLLGLHRIGAVAILGVAVEWEQRPYQWAINERLSTARNYHGGFLRVLRTTIRLAPAEGGTRLAHVIDVIPRSWLLAPFLWIWGASLRRRWTNAFHVIDSYVSGSTRHFPLEAPPGPIPEAILHHVGQIERAGIPPALVARLIDQLMRADEADLDYMRPLVLADRWRESRELVLELFLRAAHEGLLFRIWSLLCPNCQTRSACVRRLKELPPRAACDGCGQNLFGRLDETVELAFRPRSAIRAVRDWSVGDGGPRETPNVVFQGMAKAEESLALRLDVAPGAYRLRRPHLGDYVHVIFEGPVGGVERPGTAVLRPENIDWPGTTLAGSRLDLTVHNEERLDRAIVVEEVGKRLDVVSAARVFASARAAELLREETLAPDVEWPVGNLVFLTCEVQAEEPVEALDSVLADLAAADAVCVRRGDHVAVFAFFEPVDCVRAGLALVSGRMPGIRLGASLGSCVAICAGQGIELRGRAIDQALDALQHASHGDLVLYDCLAAEVNVELLLARSEEWAVTPFVGDAGAGTYQRARLRPPAR